MFKANQPKVTDPKSRRYMMVFDEAICTIDGIETTICERAGNDNQPHRHFCVIQQELDEYGNFLDCAITSGLHRKEVLDLTKELAEAGVTAWLPTSMEIRVDDNKDNRHLSLVREKETGNSASPRFYLDLHSSKGMMENLGSWPDTPQAYKDAHSFMLEAAAAYNLPYNDNVLSIIYNSPEVVTGNDA